MCSLIYVLLFIGIMGSKRSLLQRQLDEESSEDDDELEIVAAAAIVNNFVNAKKKHSGSVKGRRFLRRDREGGHERMFQDYLAVNPTYGPEIFRRRLIHFGLICCMCLKVNGSDKLFFHFFQI